MGYERYPRGTDPQRDYYGRRDPQDYGRDYGSGRSYSYSSAREYAAAGRDGRNEHDRGDDRDDRSDYRSDGYGARGYGHAGYAGSDEDARRDWGRDDWGRGGYGRGENRGYDDRGGYGARGGRGSDEGGRYGREGYGAREGYGRAQYGRAGYGQQDSGRDRGDDGRSQEYRGSYASDGHRWQDVGSQRHRDDDERRGGGRGGQYGRQPQGYDYDERGFLARAGDEVRSWFGDEEAERRREADSRYDERYYNQQGRDDRDGDYHSWRSTQIAALDRDYDEYRQENRSRFENEFSSWRTNRQTQRQSLEKVEEHAEVVGSDGTHVGTVDKVRGDRILLTRNDADAGGRHHSIPSSWLQSVEDKKVTLSKTAAEAKRHWRDEEQNQALFRYGDNDARQRNDGTGRLAGRDQTGREQSGREQTGREQTGREGGTTDLNRSFSGTYDDKTS